MRLARCCAARAVGKLPVMVRRVLWVVRTVLVPTKDMRADILTKPLVDVEDSARHRYF